MKRRTYFRLCFLAALLLVAWTVWQAEQKSTYRPENVTQAVYAGGSIYGIDLKDGSNTVFWTDPAGSTRLFEVDTVWADGTFRISSLIADGGSYAYVYGKYTEKQAEEETGELAGGEAEADGASAETDGGTGVYRIDFLSGKMTKQWELSQPVWFLHFSKTRGPMAVVDTGTHMMWYQLQEGGVVRLWRHFKLPNTQLMINYGAGEEDLWLKDIYGNLYCYDKRLRLHEFFHNDGTKVGVDNIGHWRTGGEIRFYNLTDKAVYAVPISTAETPEVRRLSEARPLPKSFDVSRMGMTEYLEDEGLYVGILPLSDGRQVPAVYGAREQIYEELALDRSMILKNGAAALLLRELLLLLGAVLFWLIFLRKKRFPLWERLLFALVPVIAAGCSMLMEEINLQTEQSIRDRHIGLLADYGQMQLQALDWERFEKMREKERLELGDELGLFRIGTHQNAGDFENQGQKTSFALGLYYVKGRELYSGLGEYSFNIPLRYAVPARLYAAMSQAAESGSPSWLMHNSELGRWYSVFLPIERDGQVEGVLQIQASLDWELHDALHDTARILRRALLLCSALSAVIFLTLYCNTRGLEKLYRAVEQVAQGKRGVRVKLRGHSEAAAAGRAFNALLDRLEENVQDMEAYNRKYRAFVPQELFRLLGADGPDGVRTGDRKTVQAAFICLRSETEDGGLSENLRFLQQNGGIVGQIGETGLQAILPDGAAACLDTAVKLLSRECRGGADCCAGLGFGGVCLRVIGSSAHMAVEMQSDSLRFGAFLRDWAEKCGAALLASGTFMTAAGALGASYHRRLLGYVYLDVERRLEPVWEILDAGTQESLLRKEATRERFEEGVRCFMAGQFLRARRAFILVLSEDRSDRAAACYSFLCEERQQAAETARKPSSRVHGLPGETGACPAFGGSGQTDRTQDEREAPVCLDIFRQGEIR